MNYKKPEKYINRLMVEQSTTSEITVIAFINDTIK